VFVFHVFLFSTYHFLLALLFVDVYFVYRNSRSFMYTESYWGRVLVPVVFTNRNVDAKQGIVFIFISPCAIITKHVSQSCNNTQLCAKGIQIYKRTLKL
jgi:hypothetical protein